MTIDHISTRMVMNNTIIRTERDYTNSDGGKGSDVEWKYANNGKIIKWAHIGDTPEDRA